MIIYDLEIQKAVPPKDGNLLPDLKYCAGWTDYAAMGISCAVSFDYLRGFRLYDEFMLADLKENLCRSEMIVGYNIFSFDNNLLAANGIKLDRAKCYDLLVGIARAAGSPDNFKGLGLNAVAKANLETAKTGTGENAPLLYQHGRLGELFDYCRADVALTKELLDKVLQTGHLKNPRDGKWIRVKRPD